MVLKKIDIVKVVTYKKPHSKKKKKMKKNRSSTYKKHLF